MKPDGNPPQKRHGADSDEHGDENGWQKYHNFKIIFLSADYADFRRLE